MLNNDHLRESVRELAAAAKRLDAELDRVEDLAPLVLAGGLVEVEKVKNGLGKLGTKLLAAADVKPGKEKKGEQRRAFGVRPADDPAV